MVSRNDKMETPSLPNGNPEEPKGPAAEGVAFEIMILKVRAALPSTLKSFQPIRRMPNQIVLETRGDREDSKQTETYFPIGRLLRRLFPWLSDIYSLVRLGKVI